MCLGSESIKIHINLSPMLSHCNVYTCRSITKSYYRNSVGALLVYDITNRSSFEHIPLWMMEARRHIEPHRPVFALVGCKLDLVSSGGRREVTREEARAFAEQNGMHHVETSAKTGANVEEAFHAVTQEVYTRIQTGEYKVEDGWDGIKTGFQRPGGLDFNLVEAEPAKSTCCWDTWWNSQTRCLCLCVNSDVWWILDITKSCFPMGTAPCHIKYDVIRCRFVCSLANRTVWAHLCISSLCYEMMAKLQYTQLLYLTIVAVQRMNMNWQN